ncbi:MULTISPECIES: hypothetical protein [unclassified Streptomyces]|uniref:hypothetical protein n=1 Tax=unclassified Streptomyces TaxID=2593676 RepID=UPI000B587783|nr:MULTISPECIES: hypothetical protein [unclassified Streptomyces]
MSSFDLDANLRLTPVPVDFILVITARLFGSNCSGALFSLSISDLGNSRFIFTQEMCERLLIEVRAIPLHFVDL